MSTLRRCCPGYEVTGGLSAGRRVACAGTRELKLRLQSCLGATMLYRDVSLVSILGLRGTLYVQRVRDAEGVSVQAEGPYEAKVVADTWLMIYPEGQEPQEPQSPRWSYRDITIGRTHVGSVDVATK